MSEDGGIDFIPDLRPAVRRSDIDKAIAELKGLEGAEHIGRTRFNAAIDFLDQHRFYLRQQDCDLLNPLVASLDQALREQDDAQLRIVRDAFVPNTDLDEELYYEGEYDRLVERRTNERSAGYVGGPTPRARRKPRHLDSSLLSVVDHIPAPGG